MKITQKNDLMVGAFVILVVATVVAALIKTQGLGIHHRPLYIHTDDARDLRVDTKIYLQGLEVGRIAVINPRQAASGLDFLIRADILTQFPDGTPLKLRRGTDAELEQNVLGGSTLLLDVHGTSKDMLPPGEIIEHSAPVRLGDPAPHRAHAERGGGEHGADAPAARHHRRALRRHAAPAQRHARAVAPPDGEHRLAHAAAGRHGRREPAGDP